MKLGRTFATAALLGAAALPLAAPVSWAQEKPAPEQSAPAPGSDRTPAPGSGSEQVAPDRGRPSAPVAEQEPTRGPEPTPAQKRGQVAQLPAGAPETGGGPEESGFDPAVVGGAAAAVAVAGGGAAMVLRRRRVGAN